MTIREAFKYYPEEADLYYLRVNNFILLVNSIVLNLDLKSLPKCKPRVIKKYWKIPSECRIYHHSYTGFPTPVVHSGDKSIILLVNPDSNIENPEYLAFSQP